MTAIAGARPVAGTRPLLLAICFSAISAWIALGWLIAAPEVMQPSLGPASGHLLDYDSPGFSLAMIAAALGILSAALIYVLRNLSWLGDTTAGDDYRSNPELFVKSYSAFGVGLTVVLAILAADIVSAVPLA